ncbi:MAG: helix-turn-helix domain-containing protein [Bacteroidales bacterium]|nr:helix-turn-helix domain-containing protein [Bacteroidales bacterium]
MLVEKSNMAILAEMGARLKEYRIRKNIQQRELAASAGISLDTVVRIERGESVGVDKLIRVLRVLDMLENVDLLVPEPPMSPILLQKLKGRKKYRVR